MPQSLSSQSHKNLMIFSFTSSSSYGLEDNNKVHVQANPHSDEFPEDALETDAGKVVRDKLN